MDFHVIRKLAKSYVYLEMRMQLYFNKMHTQ